MIYICGHFFLLHRLKLSYSPSHKVSCTVRWFCLLWPSTNIKKPSLTVSSRQSSQIEINDVKKIEKMFKFFEIKQHISTQCVNQREFSREKSNKTWTSRWVTNLGSIKCEPTKTLYIREDLCNLGLGKQLLDLPPKIWIITGKCIHGTLL